MQENDFIYEEIISSPPPDSLKKSKKKNRTKTKSIYDRYKKTLLFSIKY